MIVEPKKRFSDLFVEVLNNEGYDTEIAQSFAQLQDKLEFFKPNMAIVDVYGFSENKFEIAEYISRNHPEVSLIILSALSSIDSRLYSFHLNAKGFIHKSTDTYPLLHIIKNSKVGVEGLYG